MTSFGGDLKAVMNTCIDSLLDKCEQIIVIKCKERAASGFGRCRFDWSIDFVSLNVSQKDIKKIVEDLGGLTVEWFDPNIGFSVRWMDNSEIETYKSTKVDQKKKDQKEKNVTNSNADLPSINEVSSIKVDDSEMKQ